MNQDRDIGPDEVYLRREVATQTEADMLFQEATQIVQNFHKIEIEIPRVASKSGMSIGNFTVHKWNFWVFMEITQVNREIYHKHLPTLVFVLSLK